jgi:hypothetical protein
MEIPTILVCATAFVAINFLVFAGWIGFTLDVCMKLADKGHLVAALIFAVCSFSLLGGILITLALTLRRG